MKRDIYIYIKKNFLYSGNLSVLKNIDCTLFNKGYLFYNTNIMSKRCLTFRYACIPFIFPLVLFTNVKSDVM